MSAERIAEEEAVQIKAAMEARTGNYIDLNDLLVCMDFLALRANPHYRAR